VYTRSEPGIRFCAKSVAETRSRFSIWYTQDDVTHNSGPEQGHHDGDIRVGTGPAEHPPEKKAYRKDVPTTSTNHHHACNNFIRTRPNRDQSSHAPFDVSFRRHYRPIVATTSTNNNTNNNNNNNHTHCTATRGSKTGKG
jgi:hypothetical protein